MTPTTCPARSEQSKSCFALNPELPQVACFDTAFHHDLPRVAQIIAIPRRYEAAGVRRYGFHWSLVRLSDGRAGAGSPVLWQPEAASFWPTSALERALRPSAMVVASKPRWA